MFSSRTALRTVATGALALALLGGTQAVASAAPIAPAPPGVPCHDTTRIGTVKKLSNRTTWPNGSNWRVDGKGPGTLSISRTLTSANTITGDFGGNYKVINAKLGFSVTRSTTSSTSYSIKLKSGEKRQIQVGQVWQRKSYNWKRTTSCSGRPDRSKSGTGVGNNFLRYTYRSVKI